MDNLNGMICLITGASSGIGKVAAIQLAKQGATVVILCRNLHIGQKTLQEIQTNSHSGSVDLLIADLSHQQQLRIAAQTFHTKYPKLDLLIHNAGVMLPTRQVTIDGLEATFAINHLAPFLLTHLLLDSLQAAPKARIIMVTSRAEELGRIDFDDLQKEKRYTWMSAYSQSKLANLLFAYELSRRLEHSSISIHCLHPGLTSTHLGRSFSTLFRFFLMVLRPFMQSSKKAASFLLHLALDPSLTQMTGTYFIKNKLSHSSLQSYNKQLAKQLWEESQQLTCLDKINYSFNLF